MNDAPNEPDQPPVRPQGDEPATRETLWTIIGRMGPAAYLAAAWTFMPALLGFTLLANMGPVSGWLESQGSLGMPIYIAAFVLSAGLGLLPTYAQATLGGFAFGVVGGFGAALAGFTGASLVGYAVARLVARARVEAEIERHRKAKAVRDALVGSGWWRTLGIVTLVRVPPNSPFALTNLALSAAETRVVPFVAGTAIGMAPRTLAAAVIGSQISDWATAKKPLWLVATGVVVTLLVAGVIAIIAQRAIEKVTRGAEAPEGVGTA